MNVFKYIGGYSTATPTNLVAAADAWNENDSEDKLRHFCNSLMHSRSLLKEDWPYLV